MSSNFRERTTAKVRTKTEGLLSGILYCGHCNRPMTNKYTCKGGSKTYRYYVCQNAVQKGWKSCPYPSLPATAIEDFVVGEISGISTDEKLSAEVVGNFTKSVRAELADSAARENALEKALSEIRAELAGCTDSPKTEDLRKEEIRHSEALEICRKRTEMLGKKCSKSEAELKRIFGNFDGIWANLNFKEKYELLGLLVEKVVYFGEKGEISVFYRENGIDIETAKNGNQKQNIH